MSDEGPLTDVMVSTKPKETTKTRRVPPYNVILLNDDNHSMEFVIEVLCKALGYNVERSYQLMMQAHSSGRAVAGRSSPSSQAAWWGSPQAICTTSTPSRSMSRFSSGTLLTCNDQLHTPTASGSMATEGSSTTRSAAALGAAL